MRPSLLRRSLVAVMLVVSLTVLGGASTAAGHVSGCHLVHRCPSDHGTYKWRGWRCVKPSADERDSSYSKRVRYGGRTYYCKR